jgi:hypothetical protein
MLRKIIAAILAVSTLLMFTGCAIPDSIKDDIDSILDTAKGTAGRLFSSTKETAVKLWGTAKDNAVYVYDSASDWSSDAYAFVSDKAAELIGDGKDFLEGLTDIDDISVSEIEDYAPYSTPEAELFIPYYISSLLADRGYTVYNGGVYYKGSVYGGLIFTRGKIFIQEDGEAICSCGFLQLVSDTYTGTLVTEKMVEAGLVAVTAATEGQEAQSFVVQEYARLSDFGGVKDNVYFTFRQTDKYCGRILLGNNEPDAYDRTIKNYNFDTNEVINEAPTQNEIEQLYAKDPEKFDAAVDGSNAMADYLEESGSEVSSLLVLGNDVLDGLCEKASTGYSAVTGYIKQLLSKVNIGDSPLVWLDADGQAHLLDSANAVDAERMASGLVCALGTGMSTGMKAAGTVATVAFCVKNGMVVVPVIVVTTGVCSIVYNVSNMLEGLQDVYYGAKGDVTESENPVLKLFKQVIGDDDVATLVYHIWGISTSVVSGLMTPVTKALALAKNTGCNVFQTVGTVSRAALTKLAQLAATGVASGLVNKYVGKVVSKVTGSNALGTLVGFASASVASWLVYTRLDQFDKQYNVSGINNSNPGNFETKYDTKGRVKQVKGFVKVNDSKRSAMPSMKEIGKGSELPGDERGHIIGHQLGGAETVDNLTPIAIKVNRGALRVHENTLAAAAKSGKTVYVEVKLNYEGNSNRPSELVYKYVINGETNIRIFPNLG